MLCSTQIRAAYFFSLTGLLFTLGCSAQEESGLYPDDLLSQIRAISDSGNENLPESIAFVKVAESHRPWSAIIEGGSEETFISARSAFQIRYANRTVMLDSGMDEEVHRYYGFGRDEPYFPDANAKLQQALLQADQIIITHEHGDHIAGVIRSPEFSELAPKTLVNVAQIYSLLIKPQLPQIQITQEQADSFDVAHYSIVHAVAPGIVLIRSAGHTPGHQMVYVRTSAEREFLFIGDIAWALANITELQLRSAETRSRIGEDAGALMQQMRWIKARMDEDSIVIVPSHDDQLLQRYAADGILESSLRL